MQFFPLISTAVNEMETFTADLQTPAIADALENAAFTASDFLDKFMNLDFIKEIFISYAAVFAIGFAFATVLILLTFGVFKAFSLVRID